jgi:hypothetical protein
LEETRHPFPLKQVAGNAMMKSGRHALSSEGSVRDMGLRVQNVHRWMTS